MNIEMLYRGPDAQVVFSNDKLVFGHNRLSIIGLDNGSQPIFNNDKSLALVCNGEIYNYKQLYNEINVTPKTGSDCEIIIHLYKKYGINQTLQLLDGVFSFILIDTTDFIEGKKVYIARQ